MKPAYIRWYGKRNGENRYATLRSGRKGHGYLIVAIWYWPHSPSSIEAADRWFHARAAEQDFEIVGSDRYEQE